MADRPTGREKNVTGQGKPIQKRGEGLHSGPVGSQDAQAGRPAAPQKPAERKPVPTKGNRNESK